MGIATAKYVAITTFRRGGEAVTTPVWIAPLRDGQAGFTTSSASGKAKRLAHTPAIRLQPCNARGEVEQDTEPIEAIARVMSGSESEFSDVRAAIAAKYGWQVRAIALAGKVGGVLRRKSTGMTSDAAVVIDLV